MIYAPLVLLAAKPVPAGGVLIVVTGRGYATIEKAMWCSPFPGQGQSTQHRDGRAVRDPRLSAREAAASRHVFPCSSGSILHSPTPADHTPFYLLAHAGIRTRQQGQHGRILRLNPERSEASRRATTA